MKKRNLLCILLAAMMLTALPGCGGNSTAEDDNPFVGYSIGKLSEANDAAKELFEAFNLSMLDMDNDEVPIHLLAQKTYHFQGSDFVGVTKPDTLETEEDVLQHLKYVVAEKYPNVVNVDHFQMTFDDNGNIAATAVQGNAASGEGNGSPVFGAYPNALQEEHINDSMTLEDALAFAAGKGGNDTAAGTQNTGQLDATGTAEDALAFAESMVGNDTTGGGSGSSDSSTASEESSASQQPEPAPAVDAGTISVSDYDTAVVWATVSPVKAGDETATVTINLGNNTSFDVLAMMFIFDPALSPVVGDRELGFEYYDGSVTDGTLSVTSLNPDTGVGAYVAISIMPRKGDGTLLTFDVALPKDAKSGDTYTIECRMQDFQVNHTSLDSTSLTTSFTVN